MGQANVCGTTQIRKRTYAPYFVLTYDNDITVIPVSPNCKAQFALRSPLTNAAAAAISPSATL